MWLIDLFCGLVLVLRWIGAGSLSSALGVWLVLMVVGWCDYVLGGRYFGVCSLLALVVWLFFFDLLLLVFVCCFRFACLCGLV